MRFLVLFIICMFVMPFTIMAAIPKKPAYQSYVYDQANVISDDVEQQLIQTAKALESSTGNVIVMMTLDTIVDLEPYEFGEEVIREWGIGDAQLNNGILIFVTPNAGAGINNSWIVVGDGLKGEYPGELLRGMIDTYMMPYIEKGDYTTAIANILSTFYVKMDGDVGGTDLVKPVNEDDADLPTALIIFIVIIYLSLSKFGGGGPGGRRRTVRHIYRTGGFPTSGFGSGRRSSGGGDKMD
ncbi:methanol dehydrogenase [Solibacillus sp. R5-41]|uniref:TPM domain-containing protein n=1 Tax=Solibacillus sp. R5-41 TaxID=2048654 RepID=UPI000C1293C6|nr:TPM domain-containing protein [Solibacillus sp. R5-41]ATP41723.1 methanol dehydrogenase [Solibacillus sp. R5-41]